jgi:hypothetical protein
MNPLSPSFGPAAAGGDITRTLSSSIESLLGVPDLAGLGAALHGSTSPKEAGFGVDEARGSV